MLNKIGDKMRYQIEESVPYATCLCCGIKIQDVDVIAFPSRTEYKDLYICDKCFQILIQCRENVINFDKEV